MLLANISRNRSRMQAVYRYPFFSKSLRKCSSKQYIGLFGATVGFEHLVTLLQLNVVKSHAFHETVCT